MTPSRSACLLLVGLAFSIWGCARESSDPVVLGISPYQDTYLPKLAEEKGWFEEAGVPVQTVELAWGDVIGSVVSSRGADVAITNFNSFLAAYPELRRQGARPVFFYPLFVFKGPAIMVREDSPIRGIESFLQEGLSRDSAIAAVAAQLRDLEVIATENTEMEQIVTATGELASLSEGTDYTIVHANPEDGLAAFLGGEGDAYSGGLTERFRAQEQGARVLLEAADVTPPIINGLVTTEEFASEHFDDLVEIIRVWFQTVIYMESDLPSHAQEFIQYLNSVASVQYEPDQYVFAWNEMEEFFGSAEEVDSLAMNSSGPFYWRDTWDSINNFLLDTGEINENVPLRAFLGESVHDHLLEGTESEQPVLEEESP